MAVLFLLGCGRSRDSRSSGRSEEEVSRQMMAAEAMAKHLRSRGAQTGAGVLVITQKQEGVRSRPDLEMTVEHLRQEFPDVQIVEMSADQMFEGTGLPVENYNRVVASAVPKPSMVVSLIGVPVGEVRSQVPSGDIPLLALLDASVSMDTLRNQARLPTSWTLIQPKHPQAGTGSSEDVLVFSSVPLSP